MQVDSSDYSVEVDSFSAVEWAELTNTFLDAHIYQTRSYEEIHSGPPRISHLLVKHRGEVVAAAQARIMKIPFLKCGIAYIHGGPMWRRKETANDQEVLRITLEEIKKEYALKQGLLVRIAPRVFCFEQPDYPEVLADLGYTKLENQGSYRTFRVDMHFSLDELRKQFKQKWRNCLNKAEKGDLEIVSGTDLELFRLFRQVYVSMLQRKKFDVNQDFDSFLTIQENLPDSQKMRVTIAKHDARYVVVWYSPLFEIM